MRRLIQLLLVWAVALSTAGFSVTGASAAVLDSVVVSPAVTATTAIGNDQTVRSLVVGYVPGSKVAAKRAVGRARGRVIGAVDAAGVLVVEPQSTSDSQALARQLVAQPGVAYVEPEVTATIAAMPNDPGFPMQWGLMYVGIPAAHDVTLGSPTVTVAVVDTGFDFSHPDAPTRVDTVNDWDFVDGDTIANDPHGHGTAVAGIVAAATNNGVGVAAVAPGVTVLPLRALGSTGSGTGTNIAAAIRWAADRGADVINLSLAMDGDSTPVREACRYASAKGSVIVAAAGNNGGGSVAYPAAYPEVIAVGAVTSSGARAGYSQYGAPLELAAPGGETSADRIMSLWSGARYVGTTGTSMAAPHVAGAAALVRSVVPTWSAEMVRQSLTSTSDDLGTAGRDSRFGFGLVRADRATAFAASASDDHIPGIPAPADTLVGTLDGATDPHDVFAVWVTKGDRLKVTLSSAPAGFQARLFAPSATNLTGTPLAATSATSRTVVYTATVSGTHFVDVFTPGGAGAYRVDYRSGAATKLSTSVPTSSAWGGALKVSGTLLTAMGAPIGDARVRVEAKPYGSSAWSKAGTAKTSSGGSFSANVYPKKRTQYRVVFDGVSRLYQSAESSSKTSQPYAYLTRPTGPATIRKGRSFVASGKLRPWYQAGSKTVSIKVYRRVRSDGKYVYRHYTTYKVKNSAYTTATTKYAKRVKLPYRGKWKIVAQVKGNTTFRTTKSRARYVTVY